MQDNKIFIPNLGNLIETQQASYFNFLYTGISEELKTFPNPLIVKVKFPTRVVNNEDFVYLYLLTNTIKYQGPSYTIESCLQRNLTYSIFCFLPSQYSYDYNCENDNKLKNLKKNIKKITIKQDLFLCEIPLITDQGSFIINGYEKVVISQIIRSPGVYFQKTFNNSKKIIYSALIISDKGLWTSIFLDEKHNKDNVFLALNENQTINLINEQKNKFSLINLINAFGLTFEEVLDSLKYSVSLTCFDDFSDINTKKEKTDSLALLKEKAYNQNNGIFSIGKIGRYQLNKKLKLNLKEDITYLTVLDLIEILNTLFELKYYQRSGDEIDHLKNKRIRSVGDLLQNQIKIGFTKVKKQIFKTLHEKKEALNFLTPDTDKYFNLENNIIDSRYISYTLKEFFITSQLSQFMDQINPLAELTHKRRISVFGPNGLKRDHVNLAIRDIHPSQYAKLCPVETPEGQNAGLIASLSMGVRVSSLGTLESPFFVIQNQQVCNKKKAVYLNAEQESFIPVAFADANERLNNLSVKKDSLFYQEKRKNISFYTTSSIQLISLATSLIPFIEHDDANRALMGSNMQRQAVPLIYSENPFVGTGYESNVVTNSQTVIKNYNEGSVLYTSAHYIVIKDKSNQLIYYPLKKYKRSNQKTVLTQKPVVWPNEIVFSGQIIADGASTNNGELALGTNLIVAYMPWEGYNFEDAIVISNKLLLTDALTSIHIDEYETYFYYSTKHQEKLTNIFLKDSVNSLQNLNTNGIIKIGTQVDEGDILVGKLSTVKDSELTKLIQALYKTNKTLVKDESLRVTKKGQGKVIGIKIFYEGKYENSNLKLRIVVYVAQKRKIRVGDKLSGRHGNKGIISRILPYQDMPFLPDGTPIDILFNPLGVPSRMNVGQIFECLLGLAGNFLNTRFYVAPFDEFYGKEASRILVNQKLKEALFFTKKDWLYTISSVGKILLKDGRTGEFFDNPITVGISYILKLIHLVDDKMHSRALGPYNRVTEQPLQGKAASGGQRFGEMEVWALEAYGCASTLQELLTIKSDDIDGRNDMYKSISSGQDYEKPNPSFSETLLTLIRELNSLGLDFQFFRAFSDENTLANFTFAANKEIKIFNLIEERLKLRFISDNLKFRYPDFTIKDYKPTSNFIVQIENQTKILFKQLENF